VGPSLNQNGRLNRSFYAVAGEWEPGNGETGVGDGNGNGNGNGNGDGCSSSP
jgi:hypothetical protein